MFYDSLKQLCGYTGQAEISSFAYAYGFQSWYFGYVLALALVLFVFGAVTIGGKGRWKLILWVPMLVMAAITVFTFAAQLLMERSVDNMLLEFSRENREIPWMDSVNLDILARDSKLEKCAVFQYLTDVVLPIWQKNAIKYIIFTLAGSGLAIGVHFITKRKSLLLRSVVGGGTALLILVACCVDRSFSLSPGLLFAGTAESGTVEEYTYETLSGDTVFLTDKIYAYRSVGHLYGMSYVLRDGVTIYDNEGQVLGSMNSRAYIDTCSLTEKRGWIYYGRYRREVSDFESTGSIGLYTDGYIKLSELISASGGGSGNGWAGFLARESVMRTAYILFESGIFLSPDFMQVFMPLEVYVLIPLITFYFAACTTLKLKRKR